MSNRSKCRFQEPSVLSPDTFIESAGLTAGELEDAFTRFFVTKLHGKQMQKTVFIYETFTDPITFIVMDGDWSRLDRVLINSVESDRALQDELCNLLYDPVSGEGTQYLESAIREFPIEAVKNGAKVITVGFLP